MKEEGRSRPAPEDTLAAIRDIYFGAKAATIEKDLARAIAILKTMANDDERERAAVYMEGLNEMRREWKGGRT
jgi:hypothetical protein